MKGRVIKSGRARGEALVSKTPITFFGAIDPQTGIITERGHELQGKSIKDKIFVFPYGKGSTVGPYTLYRLKKNKVAPKAILNRECEPIVAIGAIISGIPCVDNVDLSVITTGDDVEVNGAEVKIYG